MERIDERYRSYEDTIHYRQARRRIINYEKYLRCKLFGMHEPYVLIKNKYPYAKHHFLFWINPMYDQFYPISRIRGIVHAYFPTREIMHLFENVPTKRSIKGIRHIHVIIM